MKPIGKTPSAATSEEVKTATLDWPVHRHWLAATLRDAFDHNEVCREYLINGVAIPYNYDLIKKFVKKYQEVVKCRINDKHIPELMLTSVLCPMFNQLLSLSPLEHGLLCSHQLPFGGNSERGDLMIVELSIGCVILRVILIGDMKPESIGDSKVESLAYASRTARIAAGYGIQLVLVYTCYHVQLYLVQSLNQKMAVFDICEAAVPVDDEMHRFFLTLLLGVKYLISDTTTSKQTPLFNPLPGIYVAGHEIFGCRYRTFKHGDHLYKCFNTTDEVETGEKNNIDVIKSLGEKLNMGNYFEDLEIIKAFTTVQYMKYKYIEADSINHPSNKQIAEVAKILAVLHELGYVHSDIREDNIIFATDGRAYIIDFDLADREDTNYPPGFNQHSIFERHPAAVRNKPRKKEHDVYSLKKVIQIWTGSEVTANNLKDIIDFYNKDI